LWKDLILSQNQQQLLWRGIATTPGRNDGRKTILVVDYEAVIRYMVRIILAGMGDFVLEAPDGAEG